jgi:hypothetical protein
MSNGMLAQWRRGIVARGLAGAALLAVPVGVAAAIGFGTSLSGLTTGLSAIASGPGESSAQTSATTRSTALNRALIALAGTPTTTGAGGTGGGGTGGGGSGGGVGNGGGGGGSGGGAPTSTGTQGTGGGSTPGDPPVNPPVVDVEGGGGDANGLVQGVSDTVNGLLPGQ